MQKAKRIHNPLLLLQRKRLAEVKKMCSFWILLIHSTTAKTQHTFFKLPSLLSEINRWCNLIKKQNDKDGFNISSNTVLCHHNFMKEDIKNSFFRWKLLPGSVLSQNVTGKTTT